jgi:TonB family protein
MRGLVDLGWRFVVGLVFVAVLAVPGAFAQQPDRDREREADEADLQRRSFNLRMLYIMANQRRPFKLDPQLALAQMQEDFTHIQLLNKKLGLSALKTDNLDLKFVTKAADEINKRCERLKENLALPAPVETNEPFKHSVENATQLKAPIVNLARLILNFTDNPYFKEASVLETEYAQKARRDLDKIIRLSEEIGTLSKSLGQEGTPAQATNKERDPEKVALQALRRREVPVATLRCSPDEAKWWDAVRAASIEARRGDAEKFVRLLKEGHDKSYRVPIPDRGTTVLRRVPPRYTDEARRLKVSGGIAMVVDFLKDGTVGEVRMVKGLGAGLNEKAADAVRRIVFLPAVKDAQFVSAQMGMTMSFDLY